MSRRESNDAAHRRTKDNGDKRLMNEPYPLQLEVVRYEEDS